MPRVLNDTVWIGGVEYAKGTAPSGDVATQIGDHLWEEVGDGPEPLTANVPIDRLLETARAAAESDEAGDPIAAAVRAALRDLGYEVGGPALSESQPRVKEEGPSQFEATPVTEGGPAVEPAVEVPPPGTVDEGAPEAPTPSESVDPPADEPPAATETDAPPVEPVDVEVPPRSGKGSSRVHWLEYARAKGVEVADDAERNEIISACEAASVPVD